MIQLPHLAALLHARAGCEALGCAVLAGLHGKNVVITHRSGTNLQTTRLWPSGAAELHVVRWLAIEASALMVSEALDWIHGLHRAALRLV